MPRLSVVVPVGPGEGAPARLHRDLLLLPANTEILFVTAFDPRTFAPRLQIDQMLEPLVPRWLQASPGRARQQNAGARAARGQWLWFLHWDSGFGPELPAALERQCRAFPEALHYAELGFLRDGPRLMSWNARGANLRSRWFGLPFGDQGFCLSQALFQQLGGFDEAAAYGEDHLLAWSAQHQGVPLKCCGQRLYTSSRRYSDDGWLRLSLRYQCLWLAQALPQWWRKSF